MWDVAFSSPSRCFFTPLGPLLNPAAPGHSGLGCGGQMRGKRTGLAPRVLCNQTSMPSGWWRASAGSFSHGVVLRALFGHSLCPVRDSALCSLTCSLLRRCSLSLFSCDSPKSQISACSHGNVGSSAILWFLSSPRMFLLGLSCPSR